MGAFVVKMELFSRDDVLVPLLQDLAVRSSGSALKMAKKIDKYIFFEHI